jgi:hypothetical protein
MRYFSLLVLATFASITIGCGSRNTESQTPVRNDADASRPVRWKSPERQAAAETQKPKATSEEIAFAKHLTAFLDYCEGTARLLNDGETQAVFRRMQQLTDLYAAIPDPPNGVQWANTALAGSRKLQAGIQADMMLVRSHSELIDAIGEGNGATREYQKMMQECEKYGSKVKKEVRSIRDLIPTAAQIQ